jgi:hypothetical protein
MSQGAAVDALTLAAVAGLGWLVLKGRRSAPPSKDAPVFTLHPKSQSQIHGTIGRPTYTFKKVNADFYNELIRRTNGTASLFSYVPAGFKLIGRDPSDYIITSKGDLVITLYDREKKKSRPLIFSMGVKKNTKVFLRGYIIRDRAGADDWYITRENVRIVRPYGGKLPEKYRHIRWAIAINPDVDYEAMDVQTFPISSMIAYAQTFSGGAFNYVYGWSGNSGGNLGWAGKAMIRNTSYRDLWRTFLSGAWGVLKKILVGFLAGGPIGAIIAWGTYVGRNMAAGFSQDFKKLETIAGEYGMGKRVNYNEVAALMSDVMSETQLAGYVEKAKDGILDIGNRSNTGDMVATTREYLSDAHALVKAFNEVPYVAAPMIPNLTLDAAMIKTNEVLEDKRQPFRVESVKLCY